jgi:hypothetical protein
MPVAPRAAHEDVTVETASRSRDDVSRRHFPAIGLGTFGKKPGRQPGIRITLKFGADQSAQAAWLNDLVMPILRDAAVASVTLWAKAASSLVCSVNLSNCSRE